MFNQADFEEATQLNVKLNVPGSSLTTIKIGGPIRFLIDVSSVPQLSRTVEYLHENHIQYRILGAGSNLLISDDGVSEPVIRLSGDFDKVTVMSPRIVVGGGASLMRASRDMSAHGLAGLEFAAGIPGSFGAAVRMNAGAHGSDIAAVFESALVVNEDGSTQLMNLSDLQFSYRRSALRPSQIVAEATLLLCPDSPDAINTRRTEALESRKRTQPLQMPSCGSVFKNPKEGAAGHFIEMAGLKGFRRGGAQISEKHANWIVNPERQAKAADVLYLIKLCQEEVLNKFKVHLEPEVIHWQPFTLPTDTQPLG